MSSTVLYVSVTAIGFLLAGTAAALAIGTAINVIGSTVSTVNVDCCGSAVGAATARLRVLSRRTHPSKAHNNGGSAGPAGPGATNGEINAETSFVATLTAASGASVASSSVALRASRPPR